MKQVLIVDDSEENLYLLQTLFRGHNYAVEVAHHGAEALTKARLRPPAMIVSDLLMPVLDGYALLRQWKTDDRLKNIPFIVYTATYTEPRDERLAMALGADAFIIKPAEPDDLIARVNDVMARHERGEQLANSDRPLEEILLLKDYNEVLVRKLEKKAAQLEQANRELIAEIEERKQASAALSDSEDRYRRLFNVISDPLFVYDRETLGYLAVNDAAVKKYGYSREEFLGMTVKDIRPEEDVAPLVDMLSKTGTGFEERGIWRHRTRDGTIMEVEISANGLEYAGRPACVIQARDVTEKRRVAAEAARTHDLLRAVVEGTPDALFVKDLNGKYLLFNSAASRFVGKPAEEVLGQDDTALFDAESARRVIEHDHRVIAANQADTEEELLTAAGITRTYLATKIPFRDTQGKIIGVLGISRDITDQKRAEEVLRQQQALLRIAGRVARIGGWSINLDTQTLTWSDEICTIHEVPFGYQPTLDHAIHFYPPEYRDQVHRHVQDCATHGTPFDYVMELITAKGRRIWVRAIGEAVRDAAGRITGLQGAFQDITERKKALDEQQQLAERLATTLESMTDGFMTLDREWRITYLNAEAEKLVDCQREDLIGITLWEAFPDSLEASFGREYRRAITEQVTVEFEEYFPPLSKWFGVRAYPSEQGLAIYFRDVTAARKLTEELINERSRLVTAQAVAKIGSWETNSTSLEVIWSAETYRIFEKNPDAFQPTHARFLEMVHPDDRAAVDRAFHDSLCLTTPCSIEHRIIMPDGRIKVLEERWQVIFDSEQKPVRVSGTCQDITERKFAEQAIRDSEERFRLLSKATNDAIWDWDLTTDRLWWNEGFEKLFGYRRAEIDPTILSWQKHIHPEDLEAVLTKVDRAIHGEAESWAGEYRFVRKNGSIAYVLDRGYIIRDSEGKAVRMIGGMTDLTARKQAEETLLLRDRAIQAVSQGIIITDPNQPDNPIIFASGGFERITGYSLEEVIGKNCRLLQGKDTDQETLRELRAAIAAPRNCMVEILNYRKDGKPFWNQLIITPVLDASGLLTHFVGVQTDVSERRRLEDQYRQSQKMEAVGRLAGGVAHDFNNLLTIISGYSELLLAMPGVDPRVRESIVSISRAGERAASLTRQLLGFSRQTMLQPKVLDLNAVISETGKMLRRLIGEDILFTTVLDPNLSLVKVDPGQLDQVLMNLAVNARDAMPKGGKLTIETSNVVLSEENAAMHPDCKAGQYVLLAISDNGCGMPPEVVARIFEPFFTTKEVGRGTGLGLAMVFGIIQQSGGCIHVYSEVNRGTTFRIYLPAASEQLSIKGGSGSRYDLKGTETILLVEDDEGVRGLALLSLRMYGYHVLTATDGKDALKVAKAHQGPLHLILTDVVMPNVSGPELIMQIVPEFPNVKVLFMSGYTDDAVVRHGLIESEVAFIQKPYTPLGLARKVRQVLDKKTTEEL